MGPRELNGNNAPAVGPIENKDLKAKGKAVGPRKLEDLRARCMQNCSLKA